MDTISHADLILNPDGSIYHLALQPEDIADCIILVGDPGRVAMVSAQFDEVEFQKSNREFVTHTGSYRGKRISVISTGIGTDNIDIVLNELDALVNVDLKTRMVRKDKKRLSLVRIGTTGALHGNILPGTRIISKIAGGFDGLYHYYRDMEGITVDTLTDSFKKHTKWKSSLPDPYFTEGSERLLSIFSESGQVSGITLSTPGFYAPQLRSIRLSPFDDTLIHKLGTFRFNHMQINNFEMESSALYALSALLGHEAVTLCIAVANRITKEFLKDYRPAMESLIKMVLEKISQDD
ncbi:MAG: nucleoside phosphorylase [Bacteroidota bacterium]